MFFISITNLFLFSVSIICVSLLLRIFLHRTGFILVLKKLLHSIEDRVHVHQFFKVPEFNGDSQHNLFYGKVSTYLNSLNSVEDSDFTNLVAGKKPNDIILSLDDNQTVYDDFLGARVTWKNQVDNNRTFILKIKKKDKHRILRPYIQHIHMISDEIERQNTRRDQKLYLNTNGRWRSVPLTHPPTMDTITMESDLKEKIKSDLESFLRSKHYYHRQGRAWRRSYLLHGPSGTGKSSFILAIADFLSYDVYDLDLFRVADDSELKTIILGTKNKSVIVIEDLDRIFKEESTMVTLSGLSNFMDGISSSCCSDERIFIFTTSKKDIIDPDLLRPGRIDVHIHFPLCNFTSFKSLANSYLGLKEHKLFVQVEEVFASGATMSPAEIGEILIANRSSPNRALKTVITALQTNVEVETTKGVRRLIGSASTSKMEENEGESGRLKDGMAPVKELPRKLYGLLRLKSTNKIGPFDHDPLTENSR